MKIMTILGTRPEIIRLSEVMKRLDEVCEHVIIHTGQNYDHELNEVFYDDLELRRPDSYLDVDVSSLGRALGGILMESERILREHRPRAVLVLGDTNSAMAGIMAKRMKIPLYHMEAGNRCFDANVPEETNRRIIDAIADFNLVYTEHARRHLLAEGYPQRRIYLTGSPLREVLEQHVPRIIERGSTVLERLNLEANRYLLVSLHREENVDDHKRLVALTDTLRKLGESLAMPVIISTHPRTRKRLEDSQRLLPEGLNFHPPFGFLDYNALQMQAACVLSDSGSIAEESAVLGFPAVTMRDAIERPEALDTGSVIMTGMDPEVIEASVRLAMEDHRQEHTPPCPADYQIGNCSQRVVRLMLGTAGLSNVWAGVRLHDYN